MDRPHIEDGHTDIDNELLEAIIRTHFSPAEHAVFWAVVRKTYRCGKQSNRITYTQFEELTKLGRWHVAPALQRLIQRNIIAKHGTGYFLEYNLQQNYESWMAPNNHTRIAPINAISRKTRFEVFHRDAFTCQYCGRQPPQISLELDHVKATANGGMNNPSNYTTSCTECNRGKSGTTLTTIPQNILQNTSRSLGII